MKIDTQLLLFCAEKAKEMADAYSASCDKGFPRSADDLAWLMQGSAVTKPIYYRTLRRKNPSIRAATMTDGQGHYIYFVPGLDDEEKRYLKAKELFQIFLQAEPFLTRDPVDLVRNMVLRSLPESFELDLGHATTAETLAEYAALEFLFPMQHRIDYWANGGTAEGMGALVSTYGIPWGLIGWCLSPQVIESLKPTFLAPTENNGAK